MKSNPMINSFRFLAILTFVILHAVPGHGQQLIPQPSELAYAEGRFTITPETVIVPHESDDLAGYLNDHIERVCGFRLQTVPHTPETNYISLRRGGHLGNEAYTLSNISSSGAETAAEYFTDCKPFFNCCLRKCTANRSPRLRNH